MNKQIGNVQLMQQMNRLKVLDFIRRNPDASRPIIAEKTGLSLASITNTTAYLLDLGLIYENGLENVGRVGRKSTLLRFCATEYDLICIYLSEKHINVAYTDLEGNAKEKIRVESENSSPEETVAELQKNVSSLIKRHGKKRLLGIGIAISGLILDDSRFVMSSRLKWKSFDIKNALESATNLPVFVDNVSLIKAVWYFYKHGNGTKDNTIFVDMKNGIGAVQFFDGEISRSTLGEIGHTTVERNGEPCFCGNKGCLEAMCSPQRLLSMYQSANGKRLASISELDRLYRENDKDAVYAISECGKYLGIGLATLVNLFYPSVIVINTGDFEGCPSLIREAEEELRKRTHPSLIQKLVIKQTQETEDSVIFGTAFNLCDRLFDISYSKNIVQ